MNLKSKFITMVAAIAFVICALSTSLFGEEQTKIDAAVINELVQNYQSVRLITKLDPAMNEVFVEPRLWNMMKYDDKQNFAYVLANYCSVQKGGSVAWVEIKDAYNGKKIAKYGAFGFKVIE